MNLFRRFRLADARGNGVTCDHQGLFVGETPLLQRSSTVLEGWQPRPLDDINQGLSTA
jgi:hypothetical protein